MKIVLFIDSLTSGGAQRQMLVLSNLLCERGYDITIITYHPHDFYRSLLDERIKYIYVTEARNVLQRIPSIFRVLFRLEPDVVISYLDVPNIIACICKLLGLKYKLIVSERNTTQNLSNRERIKFLLYRKADVIIPNSYTQSEVINKYYPCYKSKIITITNCADLDYFVPNNVLKKEQNTILCVGRVTPQKNLIRFIEAVSMARIMGVNVTVKWFGRKDEGYFEECKQAVNKYGLTDHFLFYDASQDIRSEYQRAGVFCLPSLYEGFPNVVGEAMCCGLPVLCSDVCDNHILVTNGDNGLLFNPYNVDEIRDALVNFFKLTPEEKMKMSYRSRARAVELLDKNVFIQKYINAIGL